MPRNAAFISLFALLGLAACNTGSDFERAAVGAGGGAVAGEAVSDDPLAGAAVGAAGGALADDI